MQTWIRSQLAELDTKALGTTTGLGHSSLPGSAAPYCRNGFAASSDSGAHCASESAPLIYGEPTRLTAAPASLTPHCFGGRCIATCSAERPVLDLYPPVCPGVADCCIRKGHRPQHVAARTTGPVHWGQQHGGGRLVERV